jgi:MSHA pilin protein MshD
MCMIRPNAIPIENARQRGFTLIELIIFIVVVGAGLAGILQVIQTTVARSGDPVVAKQALALADSILGEVVQKGFSSTVASPMTGMVTCSGSGTTRATYDCVDDYDGTTKVLFADWPAALSAYDVVIVVDAATNLGGTTTTQVKKVTVTVSRGTDVSVALVGYRANY